MATPKVGQPIAYVQGGGSSKAAQVNGVDNAAQVDVIFPGGSTASNVVYVEVGGTPPAAPASYAQEL